MSGVTLLSTMAFALSFESWSIVGEPSGQYLWLLHRRPEISGPERQALYAKMAELGYDLRLLRETRQ